MTPPALETTFVLIGHPVSHSLSPAIHAAAYAELGLDRHRYVAVDCSDEAAVRAEVDALRRGDIAGLNVTVPWKRLALLLADEVDASARETGAANVLSAAREGDACRIVAHNTDVPALAAELSRGHGGARSALVIGSGGAALASVSACLALSIPHPLITARKWRGARTASWEHADELAAMGAVPIEWPDAASAGLFRARVRGVEIVVQSTSDGMRGASDGTAVRDLVPWDALDSRAFAYDVVYNPPETPFIAAARAHGLSAESGLGMLVGQAALALQLWLGQRVSHEPLRIAALRALAEKTST